MLVGPRCNLTVRKIDKHAKTPSCFSNTKAYSLLHFLVLVGERETAYEDWVDCVTKPKRNNMFWGEREQFSVVVLMCSLISSPQLRIRCETPFRSSLQNEGHNFRLSSHCRISSSAECLDFIASSHQLTPFLFFIPRPPLIAVSFEASSTNQNSVSILCSYISIFNPGVSNYFTGCFCHFFCFVLFFFFGG